MHLADWWVVLSLLLAPAVLLIALAWELRGWGRPAAPQWKLPLTRPINAAHRGGDALFPENTLEAFRAAGERHGCKFMELDVHASRDGVPVVIHDPTVDRTTEGSGAVNQLTLEELKRLDAGFRFRGPGGGQWAGGRWDGGQWNGGDVRIPTLEEVLRSLPECWFSIDIKQKDPPCEAAVVEVLRLTHMQGRVVLGSASHAVFRRIQALAPRIPSPFTFRSVFGFFLAHWLGLARWYRPPHSALMIPMSQEEVLRSLPECWFSIDIKQKDPPCEAAVVEVLRLTHMQGRVVLGSASHAVFRRIQALAPRIPSPFTFRSVFGFFLAHWLGLARWYRPPHSALMIPSTYRGMALITSRSVQAAHRLGLLVFVWTVNDPRQMRELLNLGVDGIVTGRPDLLAEVIAEQGGVAGA